MKKVFASPYFKTAIALCVGAVACVTGDVLWIGLFGFAAFGSGVSFMTRAHQRHSATADNQFRMMRSPRRHEPSPGSVTKNG